VRGGEELKVGFMEKECVAISSSSSSDTWPKVGEAGMVATSDVNDRLAPCELEK
jgi:hypothetical protein